MWCQDISFDYYGIKIACSVLDNMILIYDTTSSDSVRSLLTLKWLFLHNLVNTDCFSHTGPVWQVRWSHPRYGPVVASYSYYKTVLVWRESTLGLYNLVYTHQFHTNIIEYVESTKTWKTSSFIANSGGVNRVSVISRKEILILLAVVIID
ncbi:protein transport protein SEC13, putative [Entamoeba dispar SAW760]|uniref:Protein transport protein SEC13, putative n=1 Tax=Entamoeba dispar (strain ATCC PRA-260 / SAW760) TaxID=370354 RepID=B0EQU9_ENTDS|nr:protein transport protein SEC13, putative [Entamoeba dispar SAW760]EDR23091.1 protein transport protein SEC13, putative [Entamoeba dispar SAW760]|eukprot:EDR23091.1 protein transport protein SEC13, putative [Entamoeba dispar SAW760]